LHAESWKDAAKRPRFFVRQWIINDPA